MGLILMLMCVNEGWKGGSGWVGGKWNGCVCTFSFRVQSEVERQTGALFFV
jgi:hypothetical protein